MSRGSGALAFTLYPWIVPTTSGMYQATASPETQRSQLLSVALLAPVTLLYNPRGFRLFSGRIRDLLLPQNPLQRGTCRQNLRIATRQAVYLQPHR